MCKFWDFSNYSCVQWSFRMHMTDILGLKFLISKFNKPRVLFMRFNTCIFSPYFLPICSSFHLRGKKPFKWTHRQTIDNNNIALSVWTAHLYFYKCDKSNEATLFPPDKSNQRFGLVHSGVVLLIEKSCHTVLICLSRTGTYKKKNMLKSVILCSLCLSVHLGNCLLEPWSLKKGSILYVLVKSLHLSAIPHLYLFSEIELQQGNGNHAECCGTSFSHTTTV